MTVIFLQNILEKNYLQNKAKNSWTQTQKDTNADSNFRMRNRKGVGDIG